MNDDELTFCKAVEMVVKTEDGVKAAKATINGSKPTTIFRMNQKKAPTGLKGTGKSSHSFPQGTCLRCGRTDQSTKDCRFMHSTCRFCQKKGHIEAVCLQKKKKGKDLIDVITEDPIQTVNSISGDA